MSLGALTYGCSTYGMGNVDQEKCHSMVNVNKNVYFQKRCIVVSELIYSIKLIV